MSFQNPVKKYPSLEQVDGAGILKVVVTNPSTLDYTSILESIDDKLDDLALIKGQLTTANSTLTSINGDTTAIKGDTSNILTQVTTTNTKLEDVKTKLDSQITLLGDLKTELQSANTKLDTANATLNTISTDITLIKADIATIKADIATIKSDVATIKADTAAIKTAVQSIDTKLDTVNSNLDSIETKLDTIHSDLSGITTILEDIKAELDIELVYTSATKVNNGTANFYSREKIEWDSETQTEISRTIEFSTDGFTWTDGEPAGTLEIGWMAVDTTTDLLDKLDDVIAAINDTSDAEQLLLNSIDTKLNDLSLIKAELVTANATLTSIEGDTSAIQTNTGDILTQVTTSNTKLEDVKTKLDTQITLLGDLKTELIDANVSLDTANATLTTISNDVATVKTDIALIKVDIAAIKTSVAAIEADTEEIKVAVQSIDTKLTTVNSNLDSIETKLDTINTTLQTEFDQTQVALGEVKDAVLATQDTFQIVDCAGASVGEPETVQKTIVLNKVISSICNTTDISDPIVAAIEAQSSASAVGKVHDLLQTPAMAVGDTVTITANKFTTVSLLAVKGEFTVENQSNDFSADITLSSGSILTAIEISEDGNGTASGSTSVPQGFDTRSNANDLDKAGNSYLITAVRAGSVLQLDLYK